MTHKLKNAQRWFIKELKLWGCFLLGIGGAIAIFAIFRRSPVFALSIVAVFETGLVMLGMRISKEFNRQTESQDGAASWKHR